MTDYNETAARAMGMAQAFHWVDRHLERMVQNEELRYDQTAAAGCGVGFIVLRLLAAELSLKALYMQETGSEPEHTHNLKFLFQSLNSATQDSLETRFRLAKQAVYDMRGQDAGQPQTLLEILTGCGDDFTRWRYVYEGRSEGAYAPTLDLLVFIAIARAEHNG